MLTFPLFHSRDDAPNGVGLCSGVVELVVGVSLGIIAGGIRELTIVVLGVEGGTHGVGNSEEVLEVLAVRDVGVQVVLEVLEHVHVLLDESVSADTGEGEGLVIEVPGGNEPLGVLASLGEGIGDVLGVGPVSAVEGSGEHLELVSELLLGLIEVDARSIELNESIFNTLVELAEGDGGGLLELNGGDGTEESGDSEVFHYKWGQYMRIDVRVEGTRP